MNKKINKGLITLSIGLLAFVIYNCEAVNVDDLTKKNQELQKAYLSSIQKSETVATQMSEDLDIGVMELSVSKINTDNFITTRSHFVIESVEVKKIIESDRRDSDHGHESDKDSNDHQGKHNKSEWITISNYDSSGKIFELITENRDSYILDSFTIPVGDYSQIRIRLLNNHSQVLILNTHKGEWHSVVVPSGEESGLKLKGKFSVENNRLTKVKFALEIKKTRSDCEESRHGNCVRGDYNQNHEHHYFMIKPVVHFDSAVITDFPAAEQVFFSPGAGFYNADQSISMNTATPGATICFTNDGTTPTCNAYGSCNSGISYSGPVLVSISQALTAIACKQGNSPSLVNSAVYTIDKPPTTPDLFTAKTLDANTIYLTWNVSMDDITSQGNMVYEICQSDISGVCSSFTPTYTVVGLQNFKVGGLLANINYYFLIRAKDQSGNVSPASLEILAYTGNGRVIDPGPIAKK